MGEWETDESVFHPYIISILEGEDESEDEKKEGLMGILADCLDNQDAIDNAIGEILTNWKKFSLSSKDTKNLVEEVKQLDITEKMHAITQQKIANSLVKKVEKSEEEKKLKEAILNGFANGGGDNDAGGDLGPANTNAESVQKEAQEQKDKLAAAAAAKKEKDKQDRINQKSQAEERKKKAQEKAAKGERKSGR